MLMFVEDMLTPFHLVSRRNFMKTYLQLTIELYSNCKLKYRIEIGIPLDQYLFMLSLRV